MDIDGSRIVYIYIYTSLLLPISIDNEVQMQRCTVDIERCCGSSNETSFALAAVVEVQMALLMTVQTPTSGQRRTKALEDDLEASGVHLKATWRALAVHFEATWSTWSPLGAHLEPTWSPLGGHLETTWSPSWPKTRPRDAQKPPKGAEERRKSLPRAAKSAPRAAKTGRRATKSAPRDSQEPPS